MHEPGRALGQHLVYDLSASEVYNSSQLILKELLRDVTFVQ